MKIQIALDMTDITKALTVAQQVAPYCDIIEIGALLILQHGIEALSQFRSTFPDKQLLVDVKIADRGRDSVTLFAQAGADIITVLAGTSQVVIHSACKTAGDYRKKVMLDLLDAASYGQSAMEAESNGASMLLFHRSADDDSEYAFEEQWDLVRGNTKLPIFVSAKINRTNIDQVLKLAPDGIVIGESIVQAADPATEAQFFYDLVKSK